MSCHVMRVFFFCEWDLNKRTAHRPGRWRCFKKDKWESIRGTPIPTLHGESFSWCHLDVILMGVPLVIIHFYPFFWDFLWNYAAILRGTTMTARTAPYFSAQNPNDDPTGSEPRCWNIYIPTWLSLSKIIQFWYSFVGLVICKHHFVRTWDVPAGNSLVSEPKKRNTLHNVNCQMAACEEMLFQWLGKLSGPWAQVHIHALCIFCFLFLRQLLIVKIDKVSVKASKTPRSSSRNMSIWSARPAYQWRKVDKIGKRDLCLANLTRTWQDRVQESFRWLRLTRSCEVGIMVLVRGFLHGPLLGSKKADPKRWPISSTSSLPIMFGAKLRFEVPCSFFFADGNADFLETRDLSWYTLYGKLVLGELLYGCVWK